jgi:hypothetical protein
MKMGRRIILYLLFFQVFHNLPSEAQDKTGYFLGINPQNNALNPAYSYNRDIIIFNPSVSFSLANSSLTFHSMFNKGKGSQDTLLFWDFEKIEKKLRQSNSVYADGAISLLFAGKILRNKEYLSFQVSRKYNVSLSYPESFVNLRYGNADLVRNKPRTIDLNNYAINGSVYDEYSFGLSKTFNHRFAAGVHVKILQGKVAVKTSRFLASIVTSDDFSRSVLTTNAMIQFSAPIMKPKPGTKRLQVDMSELKEQTSWLYYTIKNFGTAIDIGVNWTISDKIKLSGSVNDIGFIHWGAKPQQLVSNGEYLFDGFYFSSQNFEKFDAANYFKTYTDTLQTVFFPKESNESFGTWLHARSYLGISYKYRYNLNFTGLLKSTLYKNYFLFETTIGAVYHPQKRVAVSGTWSFSNYSLYNFGLGAAYTAKRYQLFAVTDNINAITILDVKGLNILLGVSWILYQE